jgi:hypothetical protein
MLSFEGVLLKKKKGITGSVYWKPHWIYADLEKDLFIQFNGAIKPTQYPGNQVSMYICKTNVFYS